MPLRTEERRGWGKRRRKRRNKDGQKGEKPEQEEDEGSRQEGSRGPPKKSIKTEKNKIKLKTNLMDITEAEFPPEVQNMRALE